MSILTNMLQAAIFVLAFFAMFEILGLRRTAVRGDFLLYIMSGIFLYMTQTKTMGAVAGAEGPASPMMQHAPMNTIIAILFIYYTIVPFEIENAAAAYGMILISWLYGIALGMVFLAIKPWNPGVVSIMSTVYQRANMIASGTMFLANSLPGYMRDMFDWNTLFHLIDQCRGFTFLNYDPHNTSISYPIYVSLIFLFLGLLGEFYTRRAVSISWSAKR